MNRSPQPDDDVARQAARWYDGLAEVLSDVGRRVAQLGEQVAGDWPDTHGREWADRIAEVGGALRRESAAAQELAEAHARQAGQYGFPAAPLTGPAGFVGRRTGARLAGTEAERVDDERGMQIAELPPTPPSG
ncbi:hypothetical protein [Pseudonocardia sp. MH-G8]|uniref:hypothetical protein n=1 Tax=Pseudonocardia sp. MH-G8 TaxID=1854588 RepID=UPI000B9FD086|nr:hypothetical protein [Pseudonocardia sp. MH-G8]OZM80577.1 hypothetical protein CFP66_20770 [Pseudonocardia sp. MH-G8]